MKINIFDNAKFEVAELLKKYFKGHAGLDMYFRPKDIKRDIDMSRYMINKVINHFKKLGYLEYVTIGGGCDDFGDPAAPWNGYKVTHLGIKELSIEQKN